MWVLAADAGEADDLAPRSNVWDESEMLRVRIQVGYELWQGRVVRRCERIPEVGEACELLRAHKFRSLVRPIPGVNLSVLALRIPL